MEQQHPGKQTPTQIQDPARRKDLEKKRVLDDTEPGDENRENEGGAARQYESGRNPDMQAQRSDRQGSQKPTQQRPEDR